MKHRHIATLLVLGALLGHAVQLHAQRPRIVRPPQKSPEERYEDMKKRPWLAATLELILPTVGHAYAGDEDGGKPMAGLMGAAAVIFWATAMTSHHCTNDRPHCWGRDILLKTCAMAIIGSRVWAFDSALRLARRTNAFYRRRLGLNDAGLALSVTPGGQLGLGVRLRF